MEIKNKSKLYSVSFSNRKKDYMMYQKKPAKYQTSFDLKAQEIPREQETHPVFSAGTEIEPV